MARRQINVRRLNRRVVHSGREFERAFTELVDASEKEADQLGRAAMLDLYTRLVQETPKDTGRAAAGFNVSEEPSEWVPDPETARFDPAAESRANAARLQAIPPGRIITISNNVSYLLPLENGHSRHAPQGFIAQSLRWCAARLSRAAAEYSKRRF